MAVPHVNTSCATLGVNQLDTWIGESQLYKNSSYNARNWGSTCNNIFTQCGFQGQYAVDITNAAVQDTTGGSLDESQYLQLEAKYSPQTEEEFQEWSYLYEMLIQYSGKNCPYYEKNPNEVDLMYRMPAIGGLNNYVNNSCYQDRNLPGYYVAVAEGVNQTSGGLVDAAGDDMKDMKMYGWWGTYLQSDIPTSNDPNWNSTETRAIAYDGTTSTAAPYGTFTCFNIYV